MTQAKTGDVGHNIFDAWALVGHQDWLGPGAGSPDGSWAPRFLNTVHVRR